jgi:hypothetical protein
MEFFVATVYQGKRGLGILFAKAREEFTAKTKYPSHRDRLGRREFRAAIQRNKQVLVLAVMFGK